MGRRGDGEVERGDYDNKKREIGEGWRLYLRGTQNGQITSPQLSRNLPRILFN